MKKYLFAIFLTLNLLINFSFAQTTPTSDFACPIIYQTLSLGMTDNSTTPKGQISSVQQYLKKYYNSKVFIVDGRFRAPTQTMVKMFQKDNKMSITGIVDLLTRRKIFSMCGISQNTTQQTAPITNQNPQTNNSAIQTCSFSGTTIPSGSSTIAFLASTVSSGQTCVQETRTCTNGILSGSYANNTCVVQQAQQQQTASPIMSNATTSTPLVKLWLHHEYGTSLDPLNPANGNIIKTGFSAFMRAFNTPVYSVSPDPQNIKAEYVLTAVSNGSTADAPSPAQLSYETSGFDKDEFEFLHASDPSNTYITSGNERVFISWRPDERTGVTAASNYNIYRALPSSIPDTTQTNWSNNLTWTKVTQTNSTNYQDTGLACSGGLCTAYQAPICYLVKSVTASGEEINYGMPQCVQYQSWHDREKLWINGADVTKAASSPAQSTFVSATYRIDYSINSSVDKGIGQIDVYAYRFPNTLDGCGPYAISQVNQCNAGFKQFETVSDTSINATAGNYNGSKNISVTVPIIQNTANLKASQLTADPVFKLKITDSSGKVYWYPQDGGYMSTSVNNRIIDRMWTGYNMNPANSSWQNAMKSYVSTLAGLGYNTVYFDEWRPLKSVDWFGEQNAAPAIEYPYPTGSALSSYLQSSNPVDKWTQALSQFGAAVRSAVPNFKLIGNTIHSYTNEQPGITSLVQQALVPLDGGLEEECLAGTNGLHLNSDWLTDISTIERISNSGKTFVCLARNNPYDTSSGKIKDTGIDPDRRLFILGSWLLVNDTTKEMYLAEGEVNNDWIKYTTYPKGDINDFPEYYLKLGNPAGSRKQVGNIWTRDFANGRVYVNPTNSDTQVTLEKNFNQVTIVNVVNQPYSASTPCTNYLNGKCEENPGNISTVSLPAGSVTVKAGQALVLLQAGNLSSTTTLKPTVAGVSTVCPAFTRSLEKGNYGDDVKQLQQFLISKKYLDNESFSGFFGLQTEQAVKNFQKDNSINQTGAVGPVTQKLINKNCKN